MNNHQPLISVLITTKNRKDELIRAVKSVILQTYKNIEIIVIDDGSDISVYKDIINYDFDYNVVFIRNDNSKGACFSRNKGIEISNGEFITGLDDDDEYHPERIEKLYNEYKRAINKPSLVCCYAKNIDDDGNIRYEKKRKRELTYSDMLKTNCVGSQALVKKDLIENIGMFDIELVASQDHDMWCRIIKSYGNAIKIEEYLYICHDSKLLTRISNKKAHGLIQFYNKHKVDMSIYIKVFNLVRLLKMIIKQPMVIKNILIK